MQSIFKKLRNSNKNFIYLACPSEMKKRKFSKIKNAYVFFSLIIILIHHHLIDKITPLCFPNKFF